MREMMFVRFTISKIRHFQVSIRGGGEDSNAQAVLEVSVVNNLSLPVVYGVFPLAIKINYMSEHTQGNPGVFFPGGLKASHHTADVYKKTWTPGPGGAAIYELYRYVPLL